MPEIKVEGIKDFEAKQGRRLVLELIDDGVDILHRCGGLAKCTTCRVEVLEGDAGVPTEREVNRLAREDALAPNVRLSCQILCEHPLTIKVINRFSESGLTDPGPRPNEDIDATQHA